MKTKILLAAFMAYLCVNSTASAQLQGIDYRSWLAEITTTDKLPESVDSDLFYELKKPELTSDQIALLATYNSKIGVKYLNDFESDHFESAINNLLFLAEKSHYAPASYAYSSLLWARQRSVCELKRLCSRKLTKKMKQHYSIAAMADSTGGAAFHYSSILGRERLTGWKEEMIRWGSIGKKKKNGFLLKQYQSHVE